MNIHDSGRRIRFGLEKNYGTMDSPQVGHMEYIITFTITKNYMKPVEFENHQYRAQISENFDL